MTRRRKSKAERRQERYEAEQREWELFRPKLEGLGSLADAVEVLKAMPLPDTPGRKFYTNLFYFVNHLSPPGASSYREKELYIRFIDTLERIGELNPDARKRVEAELRQAKEEKFWI